MLNVVLVEPEIPANTGNIGRTCVLTGSRLHLVAPGFDLSERALRRAGLAYWQSLDVRVYEDWQAFLLANHDAWAALDGTLSPVGEDGKPTPAMHLLTKRGARRHSDSRYRDGDYLVFGRESTGLDQGLIASHPTLCERIPMVGDAALANAGEWHASHLDLHPELKRDVCGNFVDERSMQVTSLNLSNAVAIVLFEALRQQGYPGLDG
jgi:tRNA (cytidine/uridine-2'-O-)-methyltransferase